MLMQQRVGVFDDESAKLGPDNQLDCVVSRANITHAQKYDMATKNGCNRPENRLKLIVGDLECDDAACQVLPHLVFLIPTRRRVETSENSGEV
jgi:hypothetical protein